MKLHRLLLALVPAVALCAGQPRSVERRALHHDTVVQGYPCARGNAWFFANGHLQRCFVSAETSFGEIRVPKGSVINLLSDGRPEYAMLEHNMLMAGLRCAGSGPLGPAEGAMTGLYPSGKFKYCFLTQDQIVQGVPCAAGGFWKAARGHEEPVELHENGKLKGCLLSGDFDGQHRGDVYRATR